MKTHRVACLAALVLAVAALAQEKPAATSEEIQIKQLERAWEQAEAKLDTSAISSIVAGSLSYIDYDGSLMNKAEYLRSVKSSGLEPDHLYDEGISVRVFGNAAVATGTFRETGTTKGKSYTRRARFTDTWIKQDGVWQCVASQSTLIEAK